MAGPEEFSRRMARLGSRVASGADRIVRMAALAADQAVVFATPVDKGRARSNWLVQLDSPARVEIDAYVPGEGGNTAAANSAAALNQAQQTIGAYNGDVHRSVNISNNLPYIGRLNEGSSAQAPANFVSKAVLAAVAQVRGAKLL